MIQFFPDCADTNTISLPLPRVFESMQTRHLVRITPQPSILDVYLIGQISNDLVITQPFQINIERDDDGTYIVSDDLFLVYGNSDNQSDAVSDYVVSLIEFYEILKKNAITNVFDKSQFSMMEKYIQPKSQRDNDAVQAIRD